MPSRPPREVGGFKLGVQIGSGSFGEVYRARRSDKEVAVKLERTNGRRPHLLEEAEFMSRIADGSEASMGIPRIYWKGEVNRKYNGMVLELLGPSLDDHFQKCDKRFSLPTVLMCGDQIISRLQYIHSKGIVHRDIKPQNFLVGRGTNASQIYVVDFGLAKTYLDPKTGMHIKFKDGRKGLVGTARYTSINNHLGIEPTRRDDLEGLGYMLLHMLRGSLPWQSIKAETKQIRNERIKIAKTTTSLHELCQGYPQELIDYIEICRKTRFDEEPQYGELRSLMQRALAKATGVHKNTPVFDWSTSAGSDYSLGSEEETTSSGTTVTAATKCSTSANNACKPGARDPERRMSSAKRKSRESEEKAVSPASKSKLSPASKSKLIADRTDSRDRKRRRVDREGRKEEPVRSGEKDGKKLASKTV